MNWSFEVIVTFVLLLDAIGANMVAWTPGGRTWFMQHARTFSRYFPITKGWALWYLVLVIWMLFMLHRVDALIA